MKCKRVVIAEYGGPEVLQVVEEKIPAPNPGECRVRILVAGVAFADIMKRKGMYPLPVPSLPFSPGHDIVGIIDELGEGASAFEVGQMVTALIRVGGYAEYICLPEAKLFPVPPGLDPAEVVCLPLNYVTAYQTMHRFAKVKPGERALIHGAAGGIGTAQIQLGALIDLEMYGTSSRPKHDLVSSLGAIPIDYRSEDFVRRIRSLTGDGVDVVFDHVGGRHLWRSFRTLRAGGRLIAYGEWSMIGEEKLNKVEQTLHSILLYLLRLGPGREVKWYELDPSGGVIGPEWYREDLTTLLDLLKEEKITPVIAERIPLIEAARAHELIENKAVCGKIVLVCNE
jgi:NADPH:quinone reductase-like Zn-dependent oxidoreductase